VGEDRLGRGEPDCLGRLEIHDRSSLIGSESESRRACRVSRHELKARKSRGRLVESRSARAARSGAEPLFERDHGGEDFLFVFYDEHLSLQRALDGGGDFIGMPRKAEAGSFGKRATLPWPWESLSGP
jgi:hypothetical protein